MTRTPGDEIVRLTTARDLQEAHLWKQALEEEGIRCRVVGDHLTEGFGIGFIFAYPELWVFRGDVENAKAILEKHQIATGESEGNEA